MFDNNTALGTFILQLKEDGDLTYRRFLNKHGDLAYCTFQISDQRYLNEIGVYAYFVGDELKWLDLQEGDAGDDYIYLASGDASQAHMQAYGGRATIF
jgi:hypothetical protein